VQGDANHQAEREADADAFSFVHAGFPRC
jgi:hypothetical protein